VLGFSLAALMVSTTKAVPTQVSAIGVSLTLEDQRVVLLGLAVLIAYFVLAFSFYGMKDIVAWRKSISFSDRTTRNRRKKATRG